MSQNIHFTNWAENIKNKKNKIKYPLDNEDIQKIIKKAKKRGFNVRVMGSTHTTSPLVCDNNETNLYLISLSKYILTPLDFQLNKEESSVEVNAGWTLGQLYDQLIMDNYFIPTQPDIPVFTIGGVIAASIHGSRLGYGLLNDSLLALKFINSDGVIVTKSEEDADFGLYRMNLGIFGVVISAKFKIEKRHMEAKVTNFFNIFNKENKIKKYMLDEFFKNIIQKSMNPDLAFPDFNHSFIDFHNNTLIAIDWKNGLNDTVTIDNYPEVRKVYKIKILELLFKTILKNYRKCNFLLKTLGKATRHQILFNIEKNFQEDKDMFWIEYGVNTIFMSYFVPIYEEGDGEINLERLYKAIEIIYNEVNNFKKKKKYFNLDFPTDIRFVVSSPNSLLSPLYSPDKKRVFVSIEILCMGNNLKLDSSNVNKYNKKINKDFRKFFYAVEQKWKEMGGFPHLTKIYGFAQGGDPFDKEVLKGIYDEETKKLVREKADKLFLNNFLRNLFEIEL